MQFAWLDLFGGKWILLDGNFKYPARSWSDENAALAQLKEEGWIISRSFRKRLSKHISMDNSRQKSRGYAMMRTIH